LFAGAQTTWEDVLQGEVEGTVKPFPLPRTARLELVTAQEPLPAPNVVAVLEGNDPKLRDQAVVYSAHYDHIGRRPASADSTGADLIYNGAWDNASGTAGILEVARGMVRLRPAPRRSVVFLFVTGEEKGLLGSRHYVRNPVFPMEQTAANINLDMTDIFGIPKQMSPLVAERSSLKGVAEAVALELGLTIGPDPTPELNTFVRSDQFSFVQVGVPSIFLRWSTEYEDVDAATARAKAKEKLDTIYHRVGDNFDPSWSWEGMRRHAQMALLLGARIANEPELPQWNEGEKLAKPRQTPSVDD
jgi:Zn-dependent M28 family amino/carboxypeptidase